MRAYIITLSDFLERYYWQINNDVAKNVRVFVGHYDVHTVPSEGSKHERSEAAVCHLV